MRISDVSPQESNTTRRIGRDLQSVSGKALCCTLSPDGQRAYLGGHSGVWRSDDGCVSWRHLEWPFPSSGSTDPAGALLGTTIYDILVSHSDPDVVFAAVAKDARQPAETGIWRSTDGGASWTRVHQFVRGKQIMGANCLSMPPDSSRTIFCAGGFSVARSTDGGASWTDLFPQQDPTRETVWHVAAGRRQGRNRNVYAVGSRVWHSLNGGNTWMVDAQPLSLGPGGDGPGSGARSIAIHPADPRVLFVATFERNDDINNSEGIVWRGTFDPVAGSQWVRLPPIPLNYPTVTDSGAGFVVPIIDNITGGLILVSSDRRTVHLSLGEPSATTDWKRIEDAQCHLDPHGFAVSANFARPMIGLNLPAGRALLVNDGGANFSTDGARKWKNGLGLSTLGIVNVAISPQKGKGPAICMGMGDNFGYASPDDGANWETQHYQGGDNDCAFCDPSFPSRVLVFGPRDGKGDLGMGRGVIYLYSSSNDKAPDTSHGTTQVQTIPGAPPLVSSILAALGADDPQAAVRLLNAAWNAGSWYHALGYRPLVLTCRGEPPPGDVDFVAIRFTDNFPELVRTTKLSKVTDAQDWQTSRVTDGPNVPVFKVGPPMPDQAVSIVQASGGHASPTFYIGDQNTVQPVPGRLRVWRWSAGMSAWERIVPGTSAPNRPAPTLAQRYYVDPYRPNLIYVLGNDHVYRSDDFGRMLRVDTKLERAVTQDGAFPIVIPDDGNPLPSLIRDMLFDPFRDGVRFAVGPAGVFQTLDGDNWTCLMSAAAMGCRPGNAAYDFASCPRALYVATTNRGLLKLAPLDPDWDFPMGSLQSASGRVSLLRVHEKGTGFGPPTDFLDAEVVAFLDTEPEKAFGFQLRTGADRGVAGAMLDVLRNAFNRDLSVRLEFIKTGCRTGRIVRIILD